MLSPKYHPKYGESIVDIRKTLLRTEDRKTGHLYIKMVFPFSVAMEVETVVHKILSKSEFEGVHNDPMQLISPRCASVSSFIK